MSHSISLKRFPCFTVIFSLVVSTFFIGLPFLNAESAQEDVERCEEESVHAERKDEVWALVNGRPIIRDEVEVPIQPQLDEAMRKMYDLRIQMLERLVTQRLLELAAQEEDISLEALVEREVRSKVPPVTNDEVKNFVVAQKAGGRNMPGSELTIRNNLYNQRYYQRFNDYIKQLRERYSVDIFLEQPPHVERKVATLDDPWQGRKMGPVVIVEFIDFQCGGCAHLQTTLKNILNEFSGKAKLIARDYPIDRHQYSQKAAEAAACAYEQDAYWEYADVLFQNQGELDVESLKRYAGTVGLDMEKFSRCLDSGVYADEVLEDRTDGITAGVFSTPTVFVNGIRAPDLSEQTIRTMVIRELRGKGFGRTASDSAVETK